MSALEFQVADRFPPGTKVGAFPRVNDFFTPGQTAAVTEAKVADSGVVKLSGLIEHGPYFLAAEVPVVKPGQAEAKEWRSVAIVASDPDPALDGAEFADQAEREAEARAKVFGKAKFDLAAVPQGAPTPEPVHRVVEGPRDTSVLAERIEGVKKGTPLASHTVTGQAVVVEDAPPTQDEVKKGTPQESDTEAGVATPVEVPKGATK